jgi:hypothetical protein
MRCSLLYNQEGSWSEAIVDLDSLPRMSESIFYNPDNGSMTSNEGLELRVAGFRTSVATYIQDSSTNFLRICALPRIIARTV